MRNTWLLNHCRAKKWLIWSSIVLLFCSSFYAVVVDAEGVTTVGVTPVSVQTGPGESLVIDITCTPGRPLKAFELKISFDATIIHVESVETGDIFDGYPTFFNTGVIDNSAGVISPIFGLILGQGNVTTAGTLISLSVSTLSTTGTSAIHLYDVGVTNETTYGSLSVTDGEIIVDATPPVIVDESPGEGYTDEPYVFQMSVSDTIDSWENLSVFVDWSHGSHGGNVSLIGTDGSFQRAVTLDETSTADLFYRAYAADSFGNSVTTAISSVPVLDNTLPSLVLDASDDLGYAGSSFSFSISASDNIAVSSVNVSWTHGSFQRNKALSYSAGSWRGTIVLDQSISGLNYRVQVNDSSGNHVQGSLQSIPVVDESDPEISLISCTPATPEVNMPVNISAEISDNIALADVFLHVVYPDASVVNCSLLGNASGMRYYCTRSYALLGLYHYWFWALDTSGNVKKSSEGSFTIGDGEAPVISQVSLRVSDPVDTEEGFGWVNISCEVTDNVGIASVNVSLLLPDGGWEDALLVHGALDSYYLNGSTVFFEPGNFTITLFATDTSGNTANYDPLTLSIAPNWDINENGRGDLLDVNLAALLYDVSHTAGWTREDVDNNGCVELHDLLLVSNHYLEIWWT
jgi:hypothetical protein